MKLLIILIMIQCVSVSVSSLGISRASYGQNCSKEVRCDSRKFLSCTNGQCDCLMPDTMVYNEVLEQCVTLAGERCQYTTVEAEKSWTDEVPCIPNAHCQQGICECDSTHYEISNGTCERKREYGGECMSNQMCDDSKHLLCGASETCTCSIDRMLSDGQCKILAENYCTDGDVCIDNSVCDLVESSSSIGKCTCHRMFFKTDNGTCEFKRYLGESCATDSQCIDFGYSDAPEIHEIPSFLICTDGICKCNSRVAMEDGLLNCKKYLHQPCNRGECIQGAECSTTCQCKSTSHFETPDQTCELRRSYDEFCISDSQCKSEFRCDQVHNTCRCPSNFALNAKTGKCALVPGQVCRSNYYSNDEKSCVSNAHCKQYDYYNYKCVCNDNTKETFTRDGYCYALENGTCNGDTLGPLTTNQCLPGLVCRGGGCTCLYKEHQVYKESFHKCFSLVGGPCTETVDCLDRNSECKLKNNLKQCRCKHGYTQAGRQCDLAFGQSCNHESKDPRCDRYGPLECSIREICECSDFQVYDNDTLTCQGLAGAKCKPNLGPSEKHAKSFCVKGATCKPFRGFENVLGLCTCQPGWNTTTERACSYAKPTSESLLPQADEASIDLNLI